MIYSFFDRWRQPIARSFDRISEAALALLVLLPFVNPIHTSPIPSFYSEWLAALCALVAIVVTLGGCALQGRSISVPSIAALPLFLAFVIAIQAAFDHVAHARQALLVASVLILASATMALGQVVVHAGRFERVALLLARFLVAGSYLQCLVLMLQRYGVAVPSLVFLPSPGLSPTGLLGQANHLANYLWMGVASVLYLMAKSGRLSISGCLSVWGIAALSVVSASRSVLIYPIGLAVIIFFAGRANQYASLWRQLTLLCISTLPLMLIVDRLNGMSLSSVTANTALGRLVAIGGDEVRSGLYRVAIEESMVKPMFGHGQGMVPWVTFQRADTWPLGSHPVVAEHTHNIFLQHLLEFGLPVAFLVITFLLYWLWRVLPNIGKTMRWWSFALLMIVGVHSQLEYPLWLIYFLLPASFFMGALTPISVQWQPTGRQYAIAFAALLFGFTTLGGLWCDYRGLERVQAAGSDPRQLPQAVTEALRLERTSLLAPNALQYLVGGMVADDQIIEGQWELCIQALRVSPRSDIIKTCAVVAHLAGRTYESERMRRLHAALYGSKEPRE